MHREYRSLEISKLVISLDERKSAIGWKIYIAYKCWKKIVSYKKGLVQ